MVLSPQELLKRIHQHNKAKEKEGETNCRCHKHGPQKRINGGMPGTNNLKGEM
jgi:hypothetical protein